MMTITYFVHGTTTDNEKDLATGWAPGELSDLGVKQSKELGDLATDKKFAVVFCSDLKRAVDSAQLAFGHKYEIISDSRLREVNYGDFTQKTDSFKQNLTDYFNSPFPNGESYKDVEKRVADFIEEASRKYDGKNIAIVAHQAPQLALDVILKEKTWQQAIKEDWRHTKSWQPGWEYIMEPKNKNTWLAKIKRTLTCVLSIAKNRTGACINCGACCRLPNNCLFLKFKPDGTSYCYIHALRPLNCRKYPRTKAEWLTQDTCGFKFK